MELTSEKELFPQMGNLPQLISPLCNNLKTTLLSNLILCMAERIKYVYIYQVLGTPFLAMKFMARPAI